MPTRHVRGRLSSVSTDIEEEKCDVTKLSTLKDWQNIDGPRFFGLKQTVENSSEDNMTEERYSQIKADFRILRDLLVVEIANIDQNRLNE